MIATWLMAMASCGDLGLTIDALPAYQAALQTPANDARDVSFRELWDHPEAFRGKPVKVRGTIARTFRTGASGELPARAEMWIVTGSGNLICAVTPDVDAKALPTGEITFQGISLGTITYAGGDVSRMAPLVVGSKGPVPVEVIAAKAPTATALSTTDLLFYTIVAVAVVMLVIRVRRRKPTRRRPEADVPLEFLDEPADDPREARPDGS